ncbi:hypothetical protein HYPSUDRAFT_1045046 [Hypholoma sublateritium FD-334 SS-4]|uniref:Uncharacterized protein n=1 Tax=Hypholoma sublateritium (strain FD-334 SS-4) TaxID=945553 RepID=A0A0D2ND81_HYPSF|nr:hypothetical protein HYPSUDRAFT_1045046 [Hypholoma sublateritium FD-334 SS-4]
MSGTLTLTFPSLQASADALRDELAITRQVAQARETTLIDAINELRLALFTCAAPPLSEPVEHESEPEQMHQTENVPPPTVPHHDPPPTNIGVHDRYGSRAVDDHHHHDALRAPVEGDAESDGEVSMELATPLVALVDIPPSPTASASGSHGDGTEDELLMDHGRGSESGDRWALVPADHLVGAERRNQDRDLYTGHPGQHVVDDSPNDPGGAETEDEGKGYVDPPSIQLPPSPGVEAAQLQADAYDRDAERENYSPDGEEEEDIVDADSPTLSHPLPGLMDPHVHTNNHSRSLYHATSSFVAELRHVEQEMALSQVQLDEGVIALARVEERVDELVAELDLP